MKEQSPVNKCLHFLKVPLRSTKVRIKIIDVAIQWVDANKNPVMAKI